MTRAEEIHIAFEKFHALHPDVWFLFCRFTRERIDRGYKHYSADAVMHRVRWETAEGGSFPELKINNNFVALYARKFHQENPGFQDFFRTRVLNSNKREASLRREPDLVSLS